MQEEDIDELNLEAMQIELQQRRQENIKES